MKSGERATVDYYTNKLTTVPVATTEKENVSNLITKLKINQMGNSKIPLLKTV